MKNILLSMILMGLVLSSSGEQMKPLTPVEQQKFWDTVHRQVLASKETEVYGEKVQVDLVYSRDTITNTPEIRLVANAGKKEYILWWVDTGGAIPNESYLEIGGKNEVVGLCFKCNPGRLLLYEINLKNALKEARQTTIGVSASAWVMDDSLEKNNDCRQEIDFLKMLDTKDYSIYFHELELHSVNDKWFISAVIEGNTTPKTKVFYQYPVGGTGLTLSKKEVIPVEPESVKICRQNLSSLQKAKQLWAALNEKRPGELVDTNALFKEFLRGKEVKCPDGGTYDVGPVGQPPKCSVHGAFKE